MACHYVHISRSLQHLEFRRNVFFHRHWKSLVDDCSNSYGILLKVSVTLFFALFPMPLKDKREQPSDRWRLGNCTAYYMPFRIIIMKTCTWCNRMLLWRQDNKGRLEIWSDLKLIIVLRWEGNKSFLWQFIHSIEMGRIFFMAVFSEYWDGSIFLWQFIQSIEMGRKIESFF